VVDENRNEGKAAPEIDLVGGAHGLGKNPLASSAPPLLVRRMAALSN
jgi:hypothetical protein